MFETAMFYELLEKLCKKCHEASKSKGFWNDDPTTGGNPDNVSIPTKIALMHSELSEMLEAYRKGNPPCDKLVCSGGVSGEMLPISIIDTGGVVRPITSMEEEIADLFIRLCDFCGRYEIDLARVTLAKMSYNSQRPMMHGGKKC